MPTYELTLILKQFQRPELNVIMKRIAKNLWERKALIRDFQYLGTRQLPTKMKRHDEFFWKGMYWVVTFDSPTNVLVDLRDELLRDMDILRNTVTKIPNEETIPVIPECKLDEESLPPAYRQDVKDMMEKGKRPVRSRQL